MNTTYTPDPWGHNGSAELYVERGLAAVTGQGKEDTGACLRHHTGTQEKLGGEGLS